MEIPNWQKFEIDVCSDLGEYYGRVIGVKTIQKLFPQRRRRDCVSLWRKLTVRETNPENTSSRKNVPTRWALKPHDWSTIPLEPFQEICKHLPASIVFNKLPLVCSHFRSLVTHHRLPVKEITAVLKSRKNMIHLNQYTHRVSKSKKLIISGSRLGIPEDSGYHFLLIKLMKHLLPNLESLECHTEWCFSFAEILSQSKKIHSFSWIAISDLKPWIWTRKELKCNSVRFLNYKDLRLKTAELRDMIEFFPNLEKVSVSNPRPTILEENDQDVWNSWSNITELSGTVLLPVPQLQKLQHLDLRVTSIWTWYKLLEILPNLPEIRSLKIQTRPLMKSVGSYPVVIHGLFQPPFLNRLAEIVEKIKTLVEIKISNELETDYESGSPVAEYKFYNLPDTVKEISYYGRRFKSDIKNKPTVGMKYSLHLNHRHVR
jgi:hypothetical protein